MKESGRAKLWVIVKRVLRKYGYPPGKQEKATQTVLRKMGGEHVADILDEIEEAQKRRRGKKRDRLDEELHYLRAGAERMDHARYEREGWPLGSKAVEGTSKHLVKERFALTGARWRRRNIAWVLALRLELFNGAFEDPNEQLVAA